MRGGMPRDEGNGDAALRAGGAPIFPKGAGQVVIALLTAGGGGGVQHDGFLGLGTGRAHIMAALE